MKLSIITVNRNNAAGLRTTLESTFGSQPGFIDWEQIVVDGASSDGSFAEVDRYRGDPHLGWCVSEPDTGIYNAMNKGAAHARGDYLLFLNSGDSLLPDVLAKVFAEPWDADIAYGSLVVTGKGPERIWVYPPPEEITPAYFLFASLPHPASFISRSLLAAIGGYDESFRIVSDAKFFLDAVCKKARLSRIEFSVSQFVYGEGLSSNSAHNDSHRHERKRMLTPLFGKFSVARGLRTESRPWIRERTAKDAIREPAFASVLLRVSDLCAALWRTRMGRFLLERFVRSVEVWERRKSAHAVKDNP